MHFELNLCVYKQCRLMILREVKCLTHNNFNVFRIQFHVLKYIVKCVCKTDDHHNAL